MKKDDSTVRRQLASLAILTRPELCERWRDLYGTEPPNSSKEFLRRRIAYRIQELFYGGLDDKLKKVFNKEPLPDRRHKTNALQDGTKLLRTWHGKDYLVTVCGNKFEYGNRLYRSLSGIARTITGSNWNGYEFFGLRRSKKCKQ